MSLERSPLDQAKKNNNIESLKMLKKGEKCHRLAQFFNK